MPIFRPLQGIFCALLAGFVADQAMAQGGRPATVGVDVVQTRTLSETVPVLGRFVALSTSVVATRVAGIVDSVDVAMGDRVNAGDVLVRLDNRLLQIERDAARALLREAEAGRTIAMSNVDLARQAFERMERLSSSAAFSKGRYNDLNRQLERARGELTRTDAQILNARAALARAEYNIEHTEVKAPFDGVIVNRAAQQGEYIPVGNPLLTVLDTLHLEIEVDVPGAIVGSLKPGLKVTAQLDDGFDLSAVVRAIIPQERVTTRTRPVRFSALFEGNDTPLAVDQSVMVHLPVSKPRRALTVPKDALVQGGKGWIVYGVIDGKAVPQPVEIGAAVDDRFEVKSGLADGLTVVVRGNERLRPGQAVQAAPDGPPKAARAPGTEGTSVQ